MLVHVVAGEGGDGVDPAGIEWAEAPVLDTPRLRLRGWGEADLAPFAALNADLQVTEFLPAPLTRAQSDALVAGMQDSFRRHLFGWWAVEVAESGSFVGFVGLNAPSFEAPFTPCVEIGWRLARQHWGHGYATEAAGAALAYGFGPLALSEIVSFTVPANVRSRAVMERLGMSRDPASDFDHPRLPPGHPLRRHVLYRLASPHNPAAGA
jgi:RimJ/RimL family protein N-acetyltransferase